MEKHANESRQFMEKARQEISELIDAAKKLFKEQQKIAGKTIVGVYGDLFEKRAKNDAKASYIWLGATLVAIVGAVILIIVMWDKFSDIDPKNTALIVQAAINKLVVISLLYFAIVWAARNYSAHRHNQTLNIHRQIALDSFKTFVDVTKGTPVADVVTRIAAQAIFAPQPTGFTKTEAGKEPSASGILEVITKNLEG